MKVLSPLVLFLGLVLSSYGQVKIGDHINSIDSNSILELESNSKVLVVTRITNAEMNAITPINGALAYNTDEDCLYQYRNNIWTSLCIDITGGQTITSLTDNNDGSFTYSDENGIDARIEKANLIDNSDGTYTFSNSTTTLLINTAANSNSYNNNISGITASNVQEAIDFIKKETDSAIVALQNDINTNTTNFTTLLDDKENTANKSTDGTLADNSDVDFPTEQAVKTYVDAQVGAVSQDDDITDATLNASSVLAIKEGTTEVTVDLSALEESDDITANTTAIANEVTRATNAETANANNISSNNTEIAANITAIASLGTDKENTANKSTDGTLADNSDIDFPTEQAVKTYVDAQVGAVSQDDDITDATLNASSILAIKEGTTEVTVDLSALEESDDITANTTAIANEVTRATAAEAANATAISNEVTRATNAETANANNISSNDTEIAANTTAIASLGTDKENTANKSTDGTLVDNSDVDFPTEQAVKTYVDAQVGAVSQDDDITDATLNASSVLAIQEGTTEVTVDLSALEESDDITANTTAIANEVTRATTAETANATAISNEVTRATDAETANANNISSNDTEIAANITAIASLGTDKENTANKSTDGTLVDNSDVDFPTEQAVKTYVDAQVGTVSQDDDITDATLNASSVLAIKEGTTEVTVDLSALEESDDITANTTAIANEVTRATDAETVNATAISNEVTRATDAETTNATAIASLGTDKENTANKSTDGTLADNSDVDFPTEQAVKTYVDAQVGAVSQDDDITDATLNSSSILAIKEGTTEVTVDLSALEESDDITANTTAIANEVTRATAAETANTTAIANEVTRATDAETANTNNISSNDTEIAANITAITALGTDKENTANKSTDGTLVDNSDVDFPTEQAVKTYVDAQVGAVSQDDDITDATLNASSVLAIKEGTTEVTVDLSTLEESDDITANTTAIANEVTRATDAETANATAISNEVTRATNAETANTTAIANEVTRATTAETTNATAITALGTDKENTANKSTDGTLVDNSDVDFPTEQAVKTYVDAQVGTVSQDDDITDATLNASSVLAIKEGTTEVTVDLSALEESDDITANTTAIANEVTRATDAETTNATAIASLGTDKENTANKSTDGTLADNSDVDFPTEQAVKTYVDAQVGAVSQDDDITDATLNASSILAIQEGTTEVTVDLSALEESDDITVNTTAIANEVTRATAAETANATAISNEVTRATNAETANTNNISSNDTEIAANITAIAALGTDKENTANKSTDGTLVDNSDVDFPTEQAVKTYVDAQVGAVSQDDDITDASLNASSILAIKEGTTEVTVDLSALEESDDITANTTAIANEVTRATAAETANTTAIANEVTRATDAETANANNISSNDMEIAANITAIASLGTDKENTANKSTDGTLIDNSDVDFPTEQAVKTYVDAQVGAVSQDDDITDATLNASSILAIQEGTTEVTVDLSALEESNDITANTTAIANEVTRATAAETANTTAISNEVTRATNAETANTNNISSNDTEIAANITAITALGTDKENTANKSIDGTLADNSDVDFPTEQAVKTYVDAQVGAVSQDDDITDATLNASSILAIQEGTTEVTVDLSALEESADITANTTAISNEVTRATDAETANANNISSNDTEIAANITAITALGTDKENTANKSTDGTLADNSDVDFPTEQAVKTYVDAQVGAVSQDDDITDATLNASSVLAIKEGTTEVTVDLSALEESDDITANTTAIANEVTRATAAETANTTAISNEVARATNAETANANNISSNDTEIAANITAIASLGTDKENTANKSTDGTLADNSDVDFPTEQAVKTYVDAQVSGISGNGDISSTDLVVGGDTNALLGDVTLEIKANAVTTAKINPGSNNQTLITNGTGAVVWVDSSTLQHTGTEGSLFFAGSDGSPTENNGQVFFDASNNRFGIGTNTPDNKLQVTGAIRSQGFLNSDGNANEPAFRFSGDTNTGMYRRAADEIGFSVGGNDAIIIDEPSTGNTHVIITQSLELEGTLTDTSNSTGTAGQVLTSTATGTAWIDPALVNTGANSSPIKAIGKIAADGSILKATTGVIITKNLNTGHYTVTLPVGATTDANYIIQLSQPGRAGEGNDDPGISYSNQTTTSFDVIIGDNDNGGGERIRFDSEFMFTILDF
ncbi:hypothetical protein [Cellulophaga baltica]|uniref:hypothetical protein n=1 Tax=Cellulophaga baltica TaxID=76594 RepID=UPI002495499E|nr:hypothetical protein [Cellulophaga baltica]